VHAPVPFSPGRKKKLGKKNFRTIVTTHSSTRAHSVCACEALAHARNDASSNEQGNGNQERRGVVADGITSQAAPVRRVIPLHPCSDLGLALPSRLVALCLVLECVHCVVIARVCPHQQLFFIGRNQDGVGRFVLAVVVDESAELLANGVSGEQTTTVHVWDPKAGLRFKPLSNDDLLKE
jgi:hypothetical protein